MDWTEIKITVDVKDIDTAESIANMVVPYGIYIEDYSNLEQDTWEIAHIDLIDEELLAKDRTKAIIHVYISPEENPSEAISFLSERFDSESIEYSIDTNGIRMEDWANNWKKYFKPLAIGDKLIIQPTWIEDAPANGRKYLRIDPGMAFGTGGHTTTKLCLETLEKYIKGGEKILDLGCGSGILSIASLLLGSASATGVDIDPMAVKTAIENGEINGFSAPQYSIKEGNLAGNISGKFDIIVANIVADIIITFSSQVKDYLKADGVFITSGIIASREDDIIEAFNQNGFKIIERFEQSDWLCFVCKI